MFLKNKWIHTSLLLLLLGQLGGLVHSIDHIGSPAESHCHYCLQQEPDKYLLTKDLLLVVPLWDRNILSFGDVRPAESSYSPSSPVRAPPCFV